MPLVCLQSVSTSREGASRAPSVLRHRASSDRLGRGNHGFDSGRRSVRPGPGPSPGPRRRSSSVCPGLEPMASLVFGLLFIRPRPCPGPRRSIPRDSHCPSFLGPRDRLWPSYGHEKCWRSGVERQPQQVSAQRAPRAVAHDLRPQDAHRPNHSASPGRFCFARPSATRGQHPAQQAPLARAGQIEQPVLTGLHIAKQLLVDPTGR
jgi:hypothetical protein